MASEYNIVLCAVCGEILQPYDQSNCILVNNDLVIHKGCQNMYNTNPLVYDNLQLKNRTCKYPKVTINIYSYA